MKTAIFILIITAILSAYFLLNRKCNYSTIALITDKQNVANLSALDNDVYIILENKSEYVSGQSIYDLANQNISSIYNINNMSTEVASISGGYFKNVVSIGHATYGMAVMFDKKNKNTYSKIFKIRPEAKEIASFRTIVYGPLAGNNSSLYVWDRHNIYNISAISGKIIREYNNLNIDTNNAIPRTDQKGEIHFVSNGNYSVIQNNRIVHVNQCIYKTLYTALDDYNRLHILSRNHKTLKLISADNGEVISKVEQNGLPILFYMKNKKILIVLSNNNMFMTNKVILTSTNNGKSWNKCNLSVANDMVLTLDENIIMRLSGTNEIIKMPAFGPRLRE